MRCQIKTCNKLLSISYKLIINKIKLIVCKECYDEFKKYKKNKFGNISKICNQGHKHRSTGEALYCDKLYLDLKAGLIKSYRYEPLYQLKVLNQYTGEIITYNHKPDFKIWKLNGKIRIDEFKGKFTERVKPLMMLMLLQYPDIEYRIVTRKDL